MLLFIFSLPLHFLLSFWCFSHLTTVVLKAHCKLSRWTHNVMWLIFKRKRRSAADWAVFFLRVNVFCSMYLFTKNLSLVLSISLCGFHNLIHTHKQRTHTRANAYQLTRWWMHNYERVCEEKLISKHKFIAINLSIDSSRIALQTQALHLHILPCTLHSLCTVHSVCVHVNCFLQRWCCCFQQEESKMNYDVCDKWVWL